YPGFHTLTPPGRGSPYGVFTPGYVPQTAVAHEVVLDDGTAEAIAPPSATRALDPLTGLAPYEASFEAPSSHLRTPPSSHLMEPSCAWATVLAPLGTIVCARSGDKGGSANIGLWVREDAGDAGRAWLLETVTPEWVREMLPETTDLPITITSLPNLRA